MRRTLLLLALLLPAIPTVAHAKRAAPPEVPGQEKRPALAKTDAKGAPAPAAKAAKPRAKKARRKAG